jgi:hypothetical protein
MKNCNLSAMAASACVLALLVFAAGTRSQTVGQNTAVPARDRVPALDLSGVWLPAPSNRPPSKDLHGFRETLPPDMDEADLFTFRHSPYPMQPWAKEKFDYNRDPDNPYFDGRGELNPWLTMCTPEGPAAKWLDNYPFEIIQSPKRVLIIFEADHEIRQIWTDGRQHPKDFGHNWMGHSIGHWEGDTLVVDTIGMNDLTWLDKAGHVHSDELHLIERLQRVGDKLFFNITFDDPKAFTTQWTARKTFQLKPHWELEEVVLCEDKYMGKSLPAK